MSDRMIETAVEVIEAVTAPVEEAPKVEVSITTNGKRNGKGKHKPDPNQAAIEQGAMIPLCSWCNAPADINDGAVKRVLEEGEQPEWLCKGCKVKDEVDAGSPAPLHITIHPDGSTSQEEVTPGDATLSPLGATETIEEALGGNMTKPEAEEAIKRISDRLLKLEKKEKELASYMVSSEEAIRQDIIAMYRRKAWVALGCKNFKEVGEKFFKKHTAHLYRLKDAALVEQRLREDAAVGPYVANVTLPEGQLRELKGIPEEKQPAAFMGALVEVTKPGGVPDLSALTAKTIKDAVKPWRPIRERATSPETAPVEGEASEENVKSHKFMTRLWYDEERKELVLNFKHLNTIFAERISLQEMIEAGVPAALFA